jgi:hypothetical protein
VGKFRSRKEEALVQGRLVDGIILALLFVALGAFGAAMGYKVFELRAYARVSGKSR